MGTYVFGRATTPYTTQESATTEECTLQSSDVLGRHKLAHPSRARHTVCYSTYKKNLIARACFLVSFTVDPCEGPEFVLIALAKDVTSVLIIVPPAVRSTAAVRALIPPPILSLVSTYRRQEENWSATKLGPPVDINEYLITSDGKLRFFRR